MLLRAFRRRFMPGRIWLLISVIGPGIIASNAANDVTGILGYSLAGAQYQYRLLWVVVLSTLALGVAQEICARMGAVTGKGLADLIREEYGVKITLLAVGALLIANFATTIAEFAGILAAVQIYLRPAARFVVLPIVAVVVWMLVARGTYKRLERILLGLSVIFLLYVVSAFLAHPNWRQVFRETAMPDLAAVHPVRDYVFMVINVIGTTITPWGQYYIQSTVRDKGIRVEEYGITRMDVLFGSVFANLVAYFIVVCCGATLFAHGIHRFDDAGQAATALAPIAGSLATLLFAVGIFNASCFGAIAVPLSTAYAVTEALGWESGVGRRAREAPLFIGTFTVMIAVAALLVMLFPKHLTTLIILPNLVGGMLLPIILVLMLRLVNKKRLMGDYTNSRTYNAIAWGTTAVLIVLSIVLIVSSLMG